MGVNLFVMTIIDTRLNRTMFVTNQLPAAFPAGTDSFAVNLDATVGEGIDIYGFDGLVDFNAADLAGLLAVEVFILRNGRITTQPIAVQFDPTDFDLVYFASSEDIGDRIIFRDFANPLRLDKGSQYTVLFLPNTVNPANNYSLFFTVRGKYLTKESFEKPRGYYSEPR